MVLLFPFLVSSSSQVLLFLRLSKLDTIEDNCNVLGRTKRSFLLSLFTLDSIAAATQRSNTVLTFWPLEALVVSQPAAPSLSQARQVLLMSSLSASSLRVWASTIGAPVLLRTYKTNQKCLTYRLLKFSLKDVEMVVSPPWPSSPARWAQPPCSRGAPRSTPSRPGAGGWSSSGDLGTDISYMRAANSCAGRRWHSAVVFIRDRLILSPGVRGRTWLNSLCSVSDIVIRMKRHTRGNNIPDQPIKKI